MRVDVLGVGFDSLTLDQAVEEGMRLLHTPGAHYVVTPNPEIVETCRQDSAARQAVNGADLVLPDGIGVIYGAKILGTPLAGRVTGISFAQQLVAMTTADFLLFLHFQHFQRLPHALRHARPCLVPRGQTRQADTPQAASLRLWGRGGLSPSPPVGAFQRPRLCQPSLCRKITRNARKQRVPCEGFSPVIPCLFPCF